MASVRLHWTVKVAFAVIVLVDLKFIADLAWQVYRFVCPW